MSEKCPYSEAFRMVEQANLGRAGDRKMESARHSPAGSGRRVAPRSGARLRASHVTRRVTDATFVPLAAVLPSSHPSETVTGSLVCNG